MVLDAVESRIGHSVHSVNCPRISKIGSMRGKCNCASLSDQLVLTPCHGSGFWTIQGAGKPILLTFSESEQSD